jgi:hypothetical protein
MARGQSGLGRDHPRSAHPFGSSITIVLSMRYRGSLKWSEGGPGGVPRTVFGEMPPCQATNTSPNVPNQPCLSICKQGR